MQSPIGQVEVGKVYYLDGKMAMEADGYVVEATWLGGMADDSKPSAPRVSGTAENAGLNNEAMDMRTSYYANGVTSTLATKCAYSPNQYQNFVDKLRNNQDLFFSGTLWNVVNNVWELDNSDFSYLGRFPMERMVSCFHDPDYRYVVAIISDHQI